MPWCWLIVMISAASYWHARYTTRVCPTDDGRVIRIPRVHVRCGSGRNSVHIIFFSSRLPNHFVDSAHPPSSKGVWVHSSFSPTCAWYSSKAPPCPASLPPLLVSAAPFLRRTAPLSFLPVILDSVVGWGLSHILVLALACILYCLYCLIDEGLLLFSIQWIVQSSLPCDDRTYGCWGA